MTGPADSGSAFALTEPQYRFGVGPILVRSPRVLAQVVFDGDLWWHIEAEVANGTAENHGGWVRRELYVDGRVVAFRRRRPPRATPPP